MHVTSNTFWLLQSLLGQSTRGTLKTCTVGVSVASVVAILFILPASALVLMRTPTREMNMNHNDIRPLDGVRVLELGNYIAAPTAGRMLADFGAEVIKVERPETGDELRNWRLYAGTTSMLYRTINRNKKSIVLDLKTERGRDIVLELVATATCCWRTSGPEPSKSGGWGRKYSTRPTRTW